MDRINNDDGGIECGVRDKYAKRWKAGEGSPYFQLYTTYSKPGLVSIFYNEDQRSFHNWGLEVGSGPKRGRIREAIDHQIDTPVLEIAGHHDGSVYMVCPPDPNQTINVDMPYVTMLMKDMHGYSSVEFTVLDTLGFSRKICAKNFKSRCTIGELNCEIPMRLSPTWNYACVNLDDTLRNAFGTKLVAVQRIKINANVRVRRIYFHEEIIPFKVLPQEFRIKLMLTPQEKEEIQMYEEFCFNVPSTSPERNIPWSMPRLMITQPSAIHNALRMSIPDVLHTAARRRVEILEVPLKDENSDKYKNITGIHAPSNSGLLKDMLLKSIPPSKILLPTLSLIYPDKKAQDEATAAQSVKVDEYLKKKGHHHKEGKFFKRESLPDRSACGGNDETKDHLRKMKRCIEVLSPRVEVQDENGNSSTHFQTDWEKFHSHGHHDQNRTHQRSNSPEPTDGKNGGGGSPRSDYDQHHHHHHHHTHGCGKYTVTDLAQYLKYRETFGDYDMFTGKVGNTKFLMVPGGETMEEVNSESESEPEAHEEESGGDDVKSVQIENPFFVHQRERGSSPSSRKSSRLTNARRSTMSRMALQDPAKAAEADIFSPLESRLSSTESWLLTWAYNGMSWAHTREINQKLLNDARMYVKPEQQGRKKSIMEVGMNPQQPHLQPKTQRGPQKLPEIYRCAVPMLPKVMKEELRGTGGYYDIIIDNPTLPIDHY